MRGSAVVVFERGCHGVKIEDDEGTAGDGVGGLDVSAAVSTAIVEEDRKDGSPAISIIKHADGGQFLIHPSNMMLPRNVSSIPIIQILKLVSFPTQRPEHTPIHTIDVVDRVRMSSRNQEVALPIFLYTVNMEEIPSILFAQALPLCVLASDLRQP